MKQQKLYALLQCSFMMGMLLVPWLQQPQQHPPVHLQRGFRCVPPLSCPGCSPVQPGPFGGAHGLLQALQGRLQRPHRSRCPC